MKNLFKTSFATFLAIILSNSLITMSEAKRITVNDEPTVLQWQVPDYEEAPRSLSYNPFYAEYHSSNVYLSSTSSIGTVSVEVTSTAGDNYVTFFDTSEGEIILPVSGDPGYYLLRITVSADEHYIGRFEL